MSKSKSNELTTTATSEKPSLQKPLVQLSEAQLKAIAGGALSAN